LEKDAFAQELGKMSELL